MKQEPTEVAPIATEETPTIHSQQNVKYSLLAASWILATTVVAGVTRSLKRG